MRRAAQLEVRGRPPGIPMPVEPCATDARRVTRLSERELTPGKRGYFTTTSRGREEKRSHPVSVTRIVSLNPTP